MYECGYCNQELVCWDYFGRVASHQDGTVLGDIYKCANEECDMEGTSFYTYRNNPNELIEGFPC